MIRTVVFDLDGTLLDTLGDLVASVNFALRQHQLPLRTVAEIRLFLGNGIRTLMRKSVGDALGEEEFEAVIGKNPTKDQMGFVHDRDVVVMYGDPAWDVKLKNPQPLGYKVDFKIKGKQCLVTITTNEYFDSTLVKGGKLKQEHVNDIPLAYYFPRRVANPRLADGQSWNVVVAEDFLLVYNCDFEKNKKYTIVLDIDK